MKDIPCKKLKGIKIRLFLWLTSHNAEVKTDDGTKNLPAGYVPRVTL